MGGYWYVGEDDGTRFCWAKEPTFRCPLADADETDPRVAEAAAALGLNAEQLARVLARTHRHVSAVRLRVDGKLTENCASCGHRLKRLGVRAWIEEPVPPAERTDSMNIAIAVNRTLGGDGVPHRTVRTTWHPTKKAAAEWARHEHKRAKKATS